ncbi:MAG: RluA family pseudouridine synthase [Lachnospiraceae bacterium]|mgnify:CR=1 FL=1|jgi:Pseudouridylate synthases, 23S RNA-specific
MQVLKITSQDEGQRLDKFLCKFMAEAPKSFFYKMLRKKNIVLNGKKAEGMERLVKGDEIKLFLSDETIAGFRKKLPGTDTLLPGSCNITGITNITNILDIIYEDNDILIINKPAGILSQKADKNDISVVEYINAYLKKQPANEDNYTVFNAGICNRLDRNTSGLIVAGKTIKGLQSMNSIFKNRELKKYYLCIVKGKIDSAERLDGYLVKNSRHNNVTITQHETEGSSRVITEYTPLQYGKIGSNVYTLLKVHLVTGKAHQIRAHLKSTGHPLAGDAKYGHKDIYQIFKREFGLKHQLLHAWRLEFGTSGNIPEKYQGMVFEAPLPEKFTSIMEGIGMDVTALRR